MRKLLQPERRSWRYRRHCFAQSLRRIPISRCREVAIGFGVGGLSAQIGLSGTLRFLSCRHSTFPCTSRLKALGSGWVWQPFCLLSTSSPRTCKCSAPKPGKIFHQPLALAISDSSIRISDFCRSLCLSAWVSSLVALALVVDHPSRIHPIRITGSSAAFELAWLTPLLNVLVGQRSLVSLGARFQAYGWFKLASLF